MAFVNGYLTVLTLQQLRYAEEQVQSIKPRNVKKLEKKITTVLNYIPTNMLKSMVGTIQIGLMKCDDNAGVYVEISCDVHKILVNNLSFSIWLIKLISKIKCLEALNVGSD
jgi:CCR4-NOT transcriptional regulation complex NOT5 subunit